MFWYIPLARAILCFTILLRKTPLQSVFYCVGVRRGGLAINDDVLLYEIMIVKVLPRSFQSKLASLAKAF